MISAPQGAGTRTPPSRRVWPVAPVAIAIASVLDPLSRNLHQAAWSDAAPAFAAAVAVALAIWLLVVRLRGGRADAGAALVACVWTAGSLHYLEIFRRLNDAMGGDYTQLRVLPVALAAMIGLTLALRGDRPWQGAVHLVVACAAAGALVGPIWRAADFERAHGAARGAWDAAAAFAAEPALAAAPAPAGPLPDIYHFVFDRYGSEETLAQFGVDDAAGAFLEGEGFYVARDAFANYVSTGHSLASTFNMTYLDAIAADPRVGGRDWRALFAMIDDSLVGRYLRGLGYDQRQYGSWWAGTFHNPMAAANRPMGLSEFDMTWLRRSIVLPIVHLAPGTRAQMLLSWDNGQCQRVARQIADIAALRRGPEGRPLYVFAHVLVPHGPYPFTPEGDCLDRPASVARGERQGYADQAVYAAAIIRELTRALLDPGRAPGLPEPAILISADEGPIPERDMRVPWQEAPAAELRVKFGILAAARFPGGDHSRMRQDISPVNLYRALLSTEFGLDLPDLPDRMLVFPDDGAIWDFHDVTARVRCAAPDAPGDPAC